MSFFLGAISSFTRYLSLLKESKKRMLFQSGLGCSGIMRFKEPNLRSGKDYNYLKKSK
jgi:hypothetical protein